MKQRITLLFVLLFVLSHGFAQNLHFDFSAMGGDTLKLYYNQGNKIDSLIVGLSQSGKADVRFPLSGFRGMMQLFNSNAGAIEFILAESDLHLVCESDHFDQGTLRFPGSQENDFLYRTFNRKAQLLGQLGWLMQGTQLYKQDTDMGILLIKESSDIQNRLTLIDDSISRSPLYAARFLEVAGFMDRLYNAEQQQKLEKLELVRTEMENTLNIAALYTSGHLWESTHNRYINLFNRVNTPDKQEQYSASILKTASRLEDLVREGFFAGAIRECERFGWAGAEETILKNMVSAYPNMILKDSQLRRISNIFRTMENSKAPALTGLKLTPEPTLLLFYESGCDNCEVQIEELKKQYSLLQQKGIRVITLSADNSEEVFKYNSRNFPWKDKLCDYKGFEGENFLKYGIVGTPTFYFIDKTGTILGRYSTLSEILEKQM
jgi:peroxiredoxin